MSVKPFEFFLNLQKAIPELERDLAEIVVKVEAEAFVAKNFRDEAFNGAGQQKWPARKKGDDPKKGKRALLVQDGTLKRGATKARTEGSNVKFTIPLAYASVHNNGERAGRGAGFQMPERKFIGESPYLDKRIEDKARKLLDQKLKDLAK